MNDYVTEFIIADDDRFRQLAAVFDALRHAKRADEWRDDDYWLEFFDQQARSHFWWPTAAELEEFERRWFSTPVARRFTDSTSRVPRPSARSAVTYRRGGSRTAGGTGRQTRDQQQEVIHGFSGFAQIFSQAASIS